MVGTVINGVRAGVDGRCDRGGVTGPDRFDPLFSASGSDDSSLGPSTCPRPWATISTIIEVGCLVLFVISLRRKDASDVSLDEL